MRQIILQPGFLDRTYMVLVEIDSDGVLKTERRDLGKHCSLERIVEVFRGYNIPIFVDPAYPQIRDELKKYGHWILK